MARTPDLDPIDALAAATAACGPRGAGRVTTDNRDAVRRWLTSNGVVSSTARSMSLAELAWAWNDTSGKALEAARRAPLIDRPEVNLPAGPAELVPVPPAMDDGSAWSAKAPAILAQAKAPAAAPSVATAAAALADALAAAQAQPAALDADAVRAIVADMLPDATAPRALAITVNDTPKGTLPAQRHRQAESLLAFVAQGIPCMVVGPAGSGKTTACEQAADALGLPFYLQGATTGAHEFLGFIDAHGRYHTTPFRQAFENGGVFLADEIDGSDPAALLVLNAALANGVMSFPDRPEPVRRHADFRMVAAANTYGRGADRQYVGRSQMDGASIDRFAMLTWEYDEGLERALSGNEDWARRVQNLRQQVAGQSVRLIVSPRATIMGARMIAAGMSQRDAEHAFIWRGLDAATIAKCGGAE
jgi:cobaltochelatase CobS